MGKKRYNIYAEKNKWELIPVYLIVEENTYPIAEMREGKALKGKIQRKCKTKRT